MYCPEILNWKNYSSKSRKYEFNSENNHSKPKQIEKTTGKNSNKQKNKEKTITIKNKKTKISWRQGSEKATAPNTTHPPPKYKEGKNYKNNSGNRNARQNFEEVKLANKSIFFRYFWKLDWILLVFSGFVRNKTGPNQTELTSHLFFPVAAHSCLAFPMLCSQLIMPFFWPPDERLEWNTHIQVRVVI